MKTKTVAALAILGTAAYLMFGNKAGLAKTKAPGSTTGNVQTASKPVSNPTPVSKPNPSSVPLDPYSGCDVNAGVCYGDSSASGGSSTNIWDWL